MTTAIKNYFDGKFVDVRSSQFVDVINPATGDLLAKTPLSGRAEVEAVVNSAHQAFLKWKDTPAVNRIQYFFNLKQLMEENFKELSELVVKEHGKILLEAQGEIRRAIQMVETACGMPYMLIGECKNDVAQGIDCTSEQRPLGVSLVIGPFNFPAMVPFWFWPFAVASGNTCVIKPSEVVTVTQMKIFELIERAGFPAGVVNMVHGSKEVVDLLLADPRIKTVSFVGSTPVAKHVYSVGSANGKRVQALGGAKNALVLLPDAPIEKSVSAMVESCLGCAGERCLAGSLLIGVGGVYEKMRDLAVKCCREVIVGNGLDTKTMMGPVISKDAKKRILNDIDVAIKEGAKILLDGRNVKVSGCDGNFIGPTIFEDVKPGTLIATKEIFGPVIGLMKMNTLDEAIEFINSSHYGNTTSIFTSSGPAARYFCSKVHPSMIGVNIGVPAPMSFFSFGGSKESFFGDAKAHGSSAVEFFTEKHISMIRWFGESLNDAESPHWAAK